jgi:soluble lytic murein transglycosylase-like protein
MAIDSVNQLSNEQLLAMSMMGNGQITNDSNSSDASNESNYAFQLAMQNLIDQSAKKTNQNAGNAQSGNNKDSNVDAKTDRNENSGNTNGDKTNIAATKIQQTYLTGQKLEDIPMMINGSYMNSSKGLDLANRSSADIKKIYSAVDSAAQKYGVDSNLILAIIKQESDFDPNSTSDSGAAGLMQIMPENFSSLGITDQYDVNQNIDGGTKLLKEYLDKYNGNPEMALMAYNAGPGTIQRRGVSSASDLYKMPEETQNYVPSVMGYYRGGI